MLSISIDDLLKLNNINIIDIRSEQRYNNNHINGAKNIPYEKLIINPSKYLNKQEKYYLYCQKGITSIKISRLLRSMGYNTINIIGGYEAWILKQ